MRELPMFEGTQSQADFWFRFNGKQFIVGGIAYRLNVRTWTAVYPRRELRLDVDAIPVNKRSKYYLERKRDLGDDWIVPVRESFEFEGEILRQIALQEVV